jgi:hypothetical protein
MYIIQEELMKYVGIDLHTNRFTCCYLADNSNEKQTVASRNSLPLIKVIEGPAKTLKFLLMLYPNTELAH